MITVRDIQMNRIILTHRDEEEWGCSGNRNWRKGLERAAALFAAAWM